ncbi:50S ribosomal protein L18 [Sulfolobus sp. A20]|uniref:50S ribosomal protein L18 n=1 Tax=Sulfolobaceae TaxID=118883 RepID=UPI000845CA7D|nr:MULTISPECIES: 50S ribosomal protein L18 [unclassified Sulfolobus]TRM73731.1 50S ribosomal protein L18 [Sulfolobus sp. E5]TRM74738.1 50S ribosomal protein L18 [Sulfolobus sp. B5]TRM74943.1 50S ribosomal protein L18 [Sulfolobus sp. A20-N-F8]TRM80216.1 50S ribosomal protein L18 [Sulfolobus sp. D5]TRM85570.1 50S ribosomal protein L18 [Sulfolobus sp. F3]TRM87108.1 50S ribosomal protein L18 [Sulfolobus sp. C3]TRM94855.1 50S ribosomal protein L18 [Sulfolobus sp. A20-N-G8]TRN01774.1 50S ribosoma
MAHGPNYKVKFRRRREGKTNYYKRYSYVVSNKLRLVVRITNKYIVAHISKVDPKGDITIAYAHSIELVKKFGWKGDTNNTSVAYLTGYLLGIRALKSGVQEAVADIGLHVPARGSRIFYVIKGAIDAGLKVPLGDVGILDDRIKGIHVAKYAEKLKVENPDKFNRLFSKYLARGLDPVSLPSHFEETLNKIKTMGG